MHAALGPQARNYPSYLCAKTCEKALTDLAAAISSVTSPACPIFLTVCHHLAEEAKWDRLLHFTRSWSHLAY